MNSIESMHTALKLGGLTTLLLVFLAPLHAADGTPQGKPNIVCFLIDDCSTHELGCYGNKANPTPNMDRLAQEGIRFNTAWGTPLCMPQNSKSSVLPQAVEP